MTSALDTASPLAALIGRVAQRDRAAFAALYNSTAPHLFGIALRILRRRDLAEETLQESFIAVWDRAFEYSPGRGSVITWLATIVRHRAIDQARRGRTRGDDRQAPEEALLTLAAGPADSADRGADLAALQHCLSGLETEPRRAVMLAYAYGLSHEEVSVQLAAPVGTVKSWIRRSLERLKRCLEG